MIPRSERIKLQQLQIKQERHSKRLKQTKKTTVVLGTGLLLGGFSLPTLTKGTLSYAAAVTNGKQVSGSDGDKNIVGTNTSSESISTSGTADNNQDSSMSESSSVQGNDSSSNNSVKNSSNNSDTSSQHMQSSNGSEKHEVPVVNPVTPQTGHNQPGMVQSHQPITNITGNSSATPAVSTNSSEESTAEVQIPANNIQIQKFVDQIGEQARTLAQDNDLYASVMIAQAAIESGFGTSGLSIAPNYNLFGIKGSYKDSTVAMRTNEDDGTGHQYTITANFRKYPSYKESLLDYIDILKTTNLGKGAYYAGAWKSHAASYKEATKYLQGRYATDTHYAAMLNSMIEQYDLTKYDSAASVKYTVKPGDTLSDIAFANKTTVDAIKGANKLNTDLILVGQTLQIPVK